MKCQMGATFIAIENAVDKHAVPMRESVTESVLRRIQESALASEDTPQKIICEVQRYLDSTSNRNQPDASHS